MHDSTGAPGTPLQQFERDTWPHFYKLAKKLPEAGVHFQSMCAHNVTLFPSSTANLEQT